MKKLLILCAFMAFAGKVSVAQTMRCDDEGCHSYFLEAFNDYPAVAADFMYEDVNYPAGGWYINIFRSADFPGQAADIVNMRIDINAVGYDPGDSFSDYVDDDGSNPNAYKYLGILDPYDYACIEVTYRADYSDGSYYVRRWLFWE